MGSSRGTKGVDSASGSHDGYEDGNPIFKDLPPLNRPFDKEAMTVALGFRAGCPPKDGIRYRAVAYQRVSKEEAETGSHTFETQALRIRERLDREFGPGCYELVTFTDDGVSGSLGPRPTRNERRVRPGLRDALEAIHTGRYDAFIVYHTDRLARDARWFLEIVYDDVLPNALFLSATEPELNLSSVEGKAMASVSAIFSAMTRDRIVARNRDAAATRTGKGYYQGQVPYGWQWEPIGDVPPGGRRRILPIPEQGRWVVQMKDWYLSGWTLFKIAGRLNEMGVPPPSADKPFSVVRHEVEGKTVSGKWHASVVWRAISCPLHAGLVSSGDRVVDGEHAERRFFDPEERERILEVKDGRKKFAPTNTNSRHNDRLLNGLVTCARCDKRLYPATHSRGKYRVFRCMAGLNTGAVTCPGVSAREDELEEAVVALVSRAAQESERLQGLLSEEAARAAAGEEDRLRVEKAQMDERVRDLTDRFSRLVDAFTRGVLQEAEFTPAANELRAEQAAARARLAETESRLSNGADRERRAHQMRSVLADFPRVWAHLDLEERREVLRQLIEVLSVDRVEEQSGPKGGGTVASRVLVRLAEGLPQPSVTERDWELVLLHRKAKRQEKPTKGVAGLTPRHLAYLHWRLEGLDGRQASERMCVQHNTIRIFEQQIRKRLGVQDLLEAARLARGRILAEKVTLPVGGNRSEEAKAKREEGEEALYLSSTLMEVLPLFAQGASTNEVAGITGLPLTTVVGRKNRILEATHSRTLFEAAQKARKAGLL